MTNIDSFKENYKTSYLASEYERLLKERDESLSMAESDKAMEELAQEEAIRIEGEMKLIYSQMEEIVKKDEEVDTEFPRHIILEVRAGAGGDEAALFAEELSSMYRKYAVMQAWRVTVVSESQSSLGGYKEATFEFEGEGVYEKMRFETGVHRIQRVPATEKMGRVHTSTASVAILPIRKKSAIVINPADIEMEFSRSGGAGGQNVINTCRLMDKAYRRLHLVDVLSSCPS